MRQRLGSFGKGCEALAVVVLLAGCGSPPEDTPPDTDTSQRPSPGSVSAVLVANRTTFVASEDVTVSVTLTNTSTRPVRLLQWKTPGTGYKEDRLRVTRDGQPAGYIGAHYKRPAPTQEDLVTLAPGESLTGDVTVSEDYDLTTTGTYTFRYLLDPRRDGELAGFASNSVSLFIEGRKSRREEEAPRRKTFASALTFEGCSQEQQHAVSDAVRNGQDQASAAHAYLGTHKTPALSTRYLTLFGLYSPANWNKATDHFLAIRDAFQTRAITVDCACDSSAYAYVYKNQPYTIHVCRAFWPAPATGQDSKAGTLLHEMSHFTAVADTHDHAYGRVNALAMALTQPLLALTNADTLEYFAENQPYLP
ncbi:MULTISPECIES: M35 family metallo-endopeptidase [Myxococcus]|uniref:M35 family metallo-endopeptidase n=1 Tax=Myxococcus TaxID=32 RepID=UPI0013D5335D|nr:MULTISPECIES: M35 family metallo-endopeptidase [Myxococcus]NVJ20805.1 peptidase M35 [Myxococcus sp. AM011]